MADEGRTRKNRFEIVSILASAGGMVSLSELLSRIPEHFPVPILYHQPILRSRLDSLRQSLALRTGLNVALLRDGQRLRAGSLYVCPGNFWVVADKGVVSLIPLGSEGRLQAGVELAGSLIASYHAGCILVLLKDVQLGGGTELLRRFEKSGVIFSERADVQSQDHTFGLELPLREIVPSLLTLLRPAQPDDPGEEEAHATPARVSGELRGVLKSLTSLAMRIHGTAMGTIQLFNPVERMLHIAAQGGFDPAFLRSFWAVPVDETSASGRAVIEGRTIVVEDVYEDERYAPHRNLAEIAGYRALQATPMISQSGRMMGVISTYFERAHRPTRSQLQILNRYALIAASVLERLTSGADRSRISSARQKRDG